LSRDIKIKLHFDPGFKAYTLHAVSFFTVGQLVSTGISFRELQEMYNLLNEI